jgi:hypothetical protein
VLTPPLYFGARRSRPACRRSPHRRVPHMGRTAGDGGTPVAASRVGGRAGSHTAPSAFASMSSPRPSPRRGPRPSDFSNRSTRQPCRCAGRLARSESVGQQRMVSLHHGSSDSWSSRPTCGPATGWCEAVPARHWSEVTRRSPTGSRSTTTGFDEFVMSGHPHLEEAYSFAEGVMPILRQRGLLAPLPGAHAPIGLPAFLSPAAAR